MHAVIYLALDFLTYIEYGKQLPTDTYYYEKSIFKEIEQISYKSSKSRNAQAANIISDKFKEHSFEESEVNKLAG